MEKLKDRRLTYRLIQNHESGWLIQETREWGSYAFSAVVKPHLASETGIAVCVQGVRRHYVLLHCDDVRLCLIKELDRRTMLAQKDFACNWDTDYPLCLEVADVALIATPGGNLVFEHTDPDRPILSGSAALVCAGGRGDFGPVLVRGRR